MGHVGVIMCRTFNVAAVMSSEPHFTIASSPRELENAHRLVREGRLAEAEQAFRRVLETQPGQTEALRFLANAALARGAAGEAVELLNRAANVDRNDIGVLLELGVAYRAADRRDESRYVLERALQLTGGRDSTARLLLANVLELDRRDDLALVHYFRAIIDAQSAGKWLNDDTTEPGLRQLVQHAIRYVGEGRRALFEAALQPVRNSAPAGSLARIDRALAIYLRESNEHAADPRQRPTFLYIPGLGSVPFLNIEPEWLHDFLERIARTGAEIDACLASTPPPEAPEAPLFSLSNLLGNLPGAAAQTERDRRIPIYQRGLLHDVPRDSAPQLLAALETAPLARVPRHGPDAELIVLPAGVRSDMRYGRSNSRCGVAVSLPGSARMSVRVGGESRALAAGESLLFDPSFGVEYFNDGGAEARVLAFEIWHPALAPVEREALSAIAVTAVDFDTRLQETD